MTIDEMITELSGLNTMFNYGPMWENLKNTGAISKLVTAGMVLLFIVTCIAMFMNMMPLSSREGREKGILAVNMPLFFKAFILGLFVLFYPMFCDTILGMFGAFTDMFFKQSLVQFQGDFHYLIASISSQSDAKTPFFFPTIKTNMEVFLFAVSLNLLIILFYVMILFCPGLIIVGLAAGPILIPFSLYSKEIGLKWALFLLAAGLMPAFVGMGIQIINMMGFINVITSSGLEGKMIQVIYMALTVAVFITTIPAVVANLFGVTPLKSLSLIMGLLSICCGMVSTSMTIIAQTFFFRKRKK